MTANEMNKVITRLVKSDDTMRVNFEYEDDAVMCFIDGIGGSGSTALQAFNAALAHAQEIWSDYLE
jgi:hypothetical protein